MATSNATRTTQHATRTTLFVLALLAIEFLDEFVYGAREAAWPLIRDDLALGYAQVGLLLAAPNVIGNLVEPFLAILGDVWRRRVIVLGGGVCFAAALLLTSISRNYGLLLASFILFYPASGAFVSLSQATLMDLDPPRREQNMARWTFAGSLGVVIGPLALGGAALLSLGWRGLFAAFAALTAILLAFAWRLPFSARTHDPTSPPPPSDPGPPNTQYPIPAFGAGLLNAFRALRRRDVLRWLVLLEFSDLMLDVLLGYLALYVTDVGGATPAQAGMAVAVWTGVGLLGDLLLIPLLEWVKGLRYLRVSVVIELLLYPAFLLASPLWTKLALLAVLGFFNSGWYAILQARLYAAMPGQSGAALAVKNVSGLVGGLVPLALGLLAERLGLQTAMWLLLLGPVALLIGLPRGSQVTSK